MISKKNSLKQPFMLGSLTCLVLLSSCMEDEAQMRELRQLREKLTVAEKKAAEAAQEAETARRELAEAANKTPDKAPDPGMTDRLRQGEQRIAELEARLAEASKQTAEAAKAAASSGTFRDHARQVQQNLMEQMGGLSERLQEQQSGPSLEEITVKKIQSGFRSEIVFSVRGANEQVSRLAFPVEADLDGRWNLPGADVIMSHLGSAPATPAAANPPMLAQNPSPPMAAAPAASLPASPRPATDTVVIQWDRPAGRPAAPMNAPAPPATAATAAPPAAAPKAPPKPVMPVTKDVQIRFD